MRRIRMILLMLAAALALPPGGFATPQSKSKSSAKPAPKKSTSAKPKSSKSSAPKQVAAKPADTVDRSKFAAVPSRSDELRGIWITTDSPRDWDRLMKQLQDSGLNAAFVRVAQGGKAIYPSDILPQDQWAADTGEDELAKAVAAARRHGIQFHAWKVVFPMGSARFRPPGSDAHAFFERMQSQDRLMRNAKGQTTSWLNPADPRNHELEARVAAEIVERYQVDGYHLDYIRYPASESGGEPGFDAHYDPVARREFEKHLGRTVAQWPDDVAAGSLKSQYEEWERGNITRLVRRIRGEIKTKRPGTLLSAAVWRKVHLYRTWIKQDWPRWCRDGLLDFVVPMCYEKDLAEFRTVLARDFSHVCGQVPFVAGIGNYRLYSPEALVDQVKAARELGSDGFVLFSINDPSDETNPKVHYKGLVDRQLSALAAGATKTPATPSVGGPRLEFNLSANVLTRRYEYLAVEAGQVSQFSARLPKAAAGSSPLRVTATIEDLRGRRIGDAQNWTIKPGTEQAMPLVAATTSVRPVIRGRLGSGPDARPFVVRGPIVEPVSAADAAELRTHLKPPRFAPSGLRVGVYTYSLGADGILDALAPSKDLAIAPIHKIDPEQLAPLQVLVLPQLMDITDLTPPAVTALRQWVHNGGRIVLTHDAVGMRWHPRLFPEIGFGTRLVAAPAVETAVALKGLGFGSKFNHEYRDHAQLQLAAPAKPLVIEQKTGKPVVAAGRLGKGLVILNGTIPGYDEEADPKSYSMKLLTALLHYSPK